MPRTVGRLFCAVSKRVPRLYMENGQVVKRSLRLLPQIEWRVRSGDRKRHEEGTIQIMRRRRIPNLHSQRYHSPLFPRFAHTARLRHRMVRGEDAGIPAYKFRDCVGE